MRSLARLFLTKKEGLATFFSMKKSCFAIVPSEVVVVLAQRNTGAAHESGFYAVLSWVNTAMI